MQQNKASEYNRRKDDEGILKLFRIIKDSWPFLIFVGALIASHAVNMNTISRNSDSIKSMSSIVKDHEKRITTNEVILKNISEIKEDLKDLKKYFMTNR